MLHPAIQQRPTVSLPQFRAVNGDALTEADFAVRRNDTGGTRLDIVLAAADGSGILKLFRLAATDQDRVRRLATAIVRKRIGEVRQELEEFFLTHARSMEFTRPDSNLVALQNVVAAGTALLSTEADLTINHPGVCAFLDNVEFLIAALPRQRIDPTMAGYRVAWAGGWRPDVTATMHAAAADVAGRAPKAAARAAALTSEVRKATIRLSAILDGMEGDEG